MQDAMIIAGGRGTRLQPLTYTCRKELLPFCGAPFLEGVLRRLAAVGIQRLFLVVGADPSPFDVLRPVAERLGVRLVAVPEPEPLDTAGGAREAVERVEGSVLVLNGDILTDLDPTVALAHHRRTGADATLVLTRVEDTSPYGVCVRDGTRIVDFVEKPPPGSLPDQDTVNAGTYVLEPAALAAFPRGRLSFERDVFPGILEAGGRLEGVVWEGVWQDLGTPARWRRGHRLVLRGRVDWPTLEEPDRDGIRVAPEAEVDQAELIGPLLVLDDAVVGPGAVVGPDAVVSAGARVAPGARMVDSLLFPGARLGRGVRAHGLIAGSGAAVEEGARLGHGVVLGDGERIEGGRVLADGERVPPRRD